METPPVNRSPEATATKPPEGFLAGFREGLNFSKIDDLRKRQHQVYSDAQAGYMSGSTSQEEAHKAGEDAIKKINAEYVASVVGEEEGESADKVAEIVERYSLIGMSDKDWHTGEYDEEGNKIAPSGIDRLRNETSEWLGNEAALDAEKEEKLTASREKLAELRETVAGYASVLQGRLFGNAGLKYREAYNAYNQQLVELGQLENQPFLDDAELDEQAKKVKVLEYLMEEQKKLRELTVEKLENTKMSRFIKKFGEFMNRGSIPVRIAKGLMIGVAVGAAGAAVGAALGVAGAGAVTVGAVGLMKMGSTFARTFAMTDAKAGRGMAKEARGEEALAAVESAESDAPNEEPVNYVERLSKVFGRQYEADTYREQMKRRKSVAAGLGAAAVGIVIGGTASVIALEHLTSGGALSHDPLFGNHGVEATDTGAADGANGGAESGNTGADVPPAEDNPHTLSQEWHEHQAELAAEQAAAEEAARQAAEQELVAKFAIQPGEGGIHFFDRLGLTEGQWYQVQGDLLNQFPQDFYQNAGQAVRIAHSGQLSEGAQAYIRSVFGL